MSGKVSGARKEEALLASRRLTMLLLEDSPEDAELLQAHLEEAGLSFEMTRVASHAAFTAALSDCQFDLILSDYHLPGFEGIAALAAARLGCPQTPFIFVTGALGEERAIELLKRGATDFVLKERLERLVPSVERALREAHERAERKRAEEALRESERALKTLIGNLPGMAFRCRPVEPWAFDYASPGALELSGYRPEDFYAGGLTTWGAIMHPDDVDWVGREAEKAFAEKRQLTVVYRIRTRSGEERWVWDRSVGIYGEDGSLQAIEGFVSDITERKRAEAEREKLALLVENSPDFVGYADLEGRPLYINQAGLRMVGLGSLEAARATHLLDFFPPEEKALMQSAVLPTVLRHGQWEADFRWRRFDSGELFPVSFRMFSVNDHKTGQPLAFATVTRDITEQKKRVEEEKKRAEFEKQLIGIVSHDLRNPLNAILLAAATVLRREELDERVIKSLLRIQSSGERATRMIRDLLDFTQARLGGGIHIQPQPVSLRQLVQQVVDEAETTHPGREIRVHHEGESQGEWDPDRLSQVIANLVFNALRYSPDSSAVTVKTGGDDGNVVLEVHNLGEPISPELRARLFQPMQRGVTGTDKGRSVGLGLYIVDHIVRGHGGTVDVHSTADEGTTFRIHLPRTAGASSPRRRDS